MQEPAPGEDQFFDDLRAALDTNKSAVASNAPATPEAPKKGGRSRLHPSNWLPNLRRGSSPPPAPETPVEDPVNETPENQKELNSIIDDLKVQKDNIGGNASIWQIMRETRPDASDAEMLDVVDEETRHLGQLLVNARVAPSGPIMTRLRDTLSERDFRQVLNKVIRELDVIKDLPNVSPEFKVFYNKWATFLDTNLSVDVGTEVESTEDKAFQKLLARELSDKSNGRIALERAGTIIAKSWSSIANRKFMGKAVGDLIVGAGVSFAVKTIAKLALGGGVGLLAGGGIGAAAGVAKELVVDYRKQSRELSGADPEFAKKRLKEKLKAMDKGRMGKAVLRGGIFGFAGGVIGADISNLVTGGHSEIFDWAKDQVGLGGTSLPDAPQTTYGITDIDNNLHPTSEKIVSPNPGQLDVYPSSGESPYSADITGNQVEAQAMDQNHLHKEWNMQKELNEQANKPLQPGKPIEITDPNQKITIKLPDGTSFTGTQKDITDYLERVKVSHQWELDKLQNQLNEARKAGFGPSVAGPLEDDQIRALAPNAGVPGAPGAPGAASALEAAKGLVTPPGMENLPKEVFQLDQVGLHADSNPWNETKAILMTAFDQKPPSDAQVMEITKMICKDSGIKVPEWGLTSGIDAHNLPPGFNLKVTGATKLAIAAMKKGG